MIEAVRAMVLVKASGRNNFPSAPIMVKTGLERLLTEQVDLVRGKRIGLLGRRPYAPFFSFFHL